MTRRHPDDALISNPNDTAPPRRGPGQQSQRHGATQRTPCSAIPKTRRQPDHALLTNPNDTAPPTPCHGQHIPKTRGTERRGCPAIPTAQRHPRETPSSNPHGTAPPTRHAQQQSPWHSGTHATRPAAIPMAQRRTRHTRDTPDAHRHCLPLRSTAQRRTRDTHDAACRCVPRNARSKLTSANPRIPCACHGFATPNARPRTRFLAQGHENLRFWRPRTIHCACHADPPSNAFPSASMHPKSHTCHAKRRSQRVKSCARATRPEPNPHGRAPATHLPARTIPAACHAKRTLAMHVQNASGTQSPRHSAAACPRHARGTPDPRSLPRKTMPRSQKCARRHTRTLATRPIPAACHAKRCPGHKNAHGATRRRSQCTRRHSESVAPSRIPAQGHGFENLVGANPPP